MVGSSVGYQWIPLDPQGPKTSGHLRISSPDQRGRRQQVPGGPEPGHSQGLNFSDIFETKVVKDDYIGN